MILIRPLLCDSSSSRSYLSFVTHVGYVVVVVRPCP
jgi:hypothetical protein